MNKSITYYNQLSFFAFFIFLLLVSLQIVWVTKAVKFQEREIIHELKEVVADVAMEVNGIEHNAFHRDLADLDHIPLELMTEKVDNYLRSNGIFRKTYFAVFQDTIGGVFRSNAENYKEAFIASSARACITCIVSFNTVAKRDSAKFNIDDLSKDSMEIIGTFQYYSPVKGVKKDEGKTLWLSLYQPDTFSAAIKSLWYLFVANVILLILLLVLFYNLLKSLSEHKQLTKVKDDFFNNMTHEFKTPLSSIRLASRVLRGNNDPAKRNTYHDLIEKESKSLEYQIDKLLELSLLDNKEIVLEKEQIDLCELIHEIPVKLKPQLEDRRGLLHLDCHLDCQLEQKNVTGDSYHLLNSFCNLVENSLKYSQIGVEIWISLVSTDEELTISIKDNGPGINKEHQAEIFSRFYRGQANDKYKGSGFGIGLSYVKSIIEAHGGSIRLNTQFDKGTEFLIKLN